MKVGIVGHGVNKFDMFTTMKALDIIEWALSPDDAVLVSGHSPVGGIDIWAEDVAYDFGRPMDLKIPKQHCWDGSYGYRARNLDIAKDSDVVHVIVVAEYPDGYGGMRFKECYHCHTNAHVKSGGCWTGLQAQKMGKPTKWHVIKRDV